MQKDNLKKVIVKKILLKDCGTIDPEDVQAYINVGGYMWYKKGSFGCKS